MPDLNRDRTATRLLCILPRFCTRELRRLSKSQRALSLVPAWTGLHSGLSETPLISLDLRLISSIVAAHADVRKPVRQCLIRDEHSLDGVHPECALPAAKRNAFTVRSSGLMSFPERYHSARSGDCGA